MAQPDSLRWEPFGHGWFVGIGWKRISAAVSKSEPGVKFDFSSFVAFIPRSLSLQFVVLI